MDKKKYKKLDIRCHECGTLYNSADLQEIGALEVTDNYLIAFCDKCSNFTYICNNRGFKSHQIDTELLK